MPAIAIFYGIVIQMFFDDHNPPHFSREIRALSGNDPHIGRRDPFWRVTPYGGAARPGMGAGATARIGGKLAARLDARGDGTNSGT